MDLVERSARGHLRHPWEQARRYAIEKLITETGLSAPCVLDIGCGDGYLIRSLTETFGFSRAVGVDVHLTTEMATELSSESVELRAELGPETADKFDLLLLLDVLEHVAEPEPLLASFVAERLRSGGFAVITAPAFQSLFCEHDRALRHYRRYTRETLAAVARSAGLEVASSGYFFASLLAPRAATVARESLATAVGVRSEPEAIGVGGWQGSSVTTRVVSALLRADAGLCLAVSKLGVTIPGLSAWLLCKKP